MKIHSFQPQILKASLTVGLNNIVKKVQSLICTFFSILFFFNFSFSIYFFQFSGLDPEYTYDFRVVAVDGDHETPSETIPVYTYPGPGKGGLNQQPMATSGWLIFIYLQGVPT